MKKLNGLVEGTSFDQILELGSESTKAGQAALPPPIMAFEEAIQQQSGPGPVAGGYCGLLLRLALASLVRDILASLASDLSPYFLFSRNDT